jgi:hypothetical protein
MKGFLVVWSGVCAALVATPLAAEPPADSEIDAIRQEIFLEGIRDCKPAAMSRCWYIFFGGDQAPGRRLWLLDLKDQSGDRTKGLVYTDVLIIDESTETRPLGAQGVFDFVLQSFEVDCRKRRMRMRPESFALGFEGQSAYAGQYGAWSDHKDTFYVRVIAASCDKDVRLRPLAHDMAWVGDYVRPVDAVDFVRRFLWKQ